MTPQPVSLGSILSEALERGDALQAQLAVMARYRSALRLADDLAETLDLDRADAWESLCSVPDNMLTLLESPHGWSTLAAYVAQDFGRVAATYAPSIH